MTMLIIVMVICVAMMIASWYAIRWPEKVWYLSHGHMYKNAEPSDLTLRIRRNGGVFGLIISTAFLIWATIELFRS